MLECLYVGSTNKTPRERFAQHKAGHRTKSYRKTFSTLVHKYSTFLRPSLYNHIKQVKTRAEAEKLEKGLALALRRKRYAVWWG